MIQHNPNLTIAITVVIGILLGLLAVKIIEYFDKCFLIQRWNGMKFVDILRVKTKANVENTLKQIGADYQKDFWYRVEPTFGWLSSRKEK